MRAGEQTKMGEVRNWKRSSSRSYRSSLQCLIRLLSCSPLSPAQRERVTHRPRQDAEVQLRTLSFQKAAETRTSSEKACAATCTIKDRFLQRSMFPFSRTPHESTSLQPGNHEYLYRNRNPPPHPSPRRHLVGTKPSDEAFFKLEPGIQDMKELRKHAIGAQEDAYKVSRCSRVNRRIRSTRSNNMFRSTRILAFSGSRPRDSRSPVCLSIYGSSNWGRTDQMQYFWTLNVATRIISFSRFALITDG